MSSTASSPTGLSPEILATDDTRSSGKKEKERKYLQSFKESKSVLEAFEKKLGRKATGEDYLKANKSVQICFKNCRKIRLYFKEKSKREKESLPALLDEVSQDATSFHETQSNCLTEEMLDNAKPSEKTKDDPSSALSFEGLFSKKELAKQSTCSSGACVDISNTVQAESSAKPKLGSTWGKHVLKKPVRRSSTIATSGTLGAKLALNIENSNAEVRSSLKKRKNSTLKRSLSAFFDTLTQDESAADESQLENVLQTSVSDPLASIDPEISQDASDFKSAEENTDPSESVNENDDVFDECVTFSNLKFPPKIKESLPSQKSIQVSYLQTQSIDGAEHNLRQVDEDWLERCTSAVLQPSDTNDEVASTSIQETATDTLDQTNGSRKRKSSSSPTEDQGKSKKAKPSKDKNDPLQAKVSKKLAKKLDDANYVKINLKKRNFVRGKKNMTGAKSRRMEWKKKMAARSANRPCFKCGEVGHWIKDCGKPQAAKLPPDTSAEMGPK